MTVGSFLSWYWAAAVSIYLGLTGGTVRGVSIQYNIARFLFFLAIWWYYSFVDIQYVWREKGIGRMLIARVLMVFIIFLQPVVNILYG